MKLDEFSRVLVILNLPPIVEEQLIDWLLRRQEDSGFTSLPVRGHSTAHEGLSIAEQVSGRQRRQQVQVEMAAAEVDGFLEGLEAMFGGAGLHYWVVPLMRSGRFGPGGSSGGSAT